MTAHQVREMAQAQISSLERQNETLREKMELIESRFHDKPTDIVSLTQAVAALNQSSRTSASSDELKTIQEQHDREMARIKEDHRSDLDRLSRERDREVDRTRVDAEARVERAEDRIKELRESFERKERDLRDDFERRERSARDEAKRTLDAMKQSYETRIEEIRQLHDRELRLHMSMQENTARTAETAHGVELRSLQNDLAKLSAELGSKQQLVDVHMAEQNRPLLDRVNEIRGMAEALGIGADKEMPAVPIGDSAPLHEKLLTLLVSQADKLLPQLTALVKKPEGQAPMTATQVQQAQMQQAQMFQQQDPRALPPRRVQRMTFADSDGPRLRSYDDLPGSGSPSPEERDEMPPTSYASSGPRPYQPPSFGDPGMPPRADSRRVQQQVSANDMMMAQQAQIQQQQAQIQQMQQQPQQQMRPATPMQKPQMVPAAQPMSSPSDVVRKQEPEEPWSHFAWIPGVPKDEVVGLATTLMQACAQKVEPTALVKAFVDQHGPEVVSMIPTIIDLGKFIESVRSDPATRATVLATGRGRRYLEDVWKCILETGESMTVEDAETKETESEAPEGVESPQPSEEPD